jgi:hypothetical protein
LPIILCFEGFIQKKIQNANRAGERRRTSVAAERVVTELLIRSWK